jgi:hypothetical protein
MRGGILSRAGSALPPIGLLVALALACSARLVREPGALLVDGERASVDRATKLGARAVGNDLTRLFLPHHMKVASYVARTGRVPGWDPSGFGGRPLIGNPQAGLFYPPTWLAWWAGTPSALGWLTVAHLVWGGIGAYVLARRISLGRWASAVAGACFEASPYLLAQAFEGHYPHVWAASWFPWAFWAAGLLRDGDPRGALALPPILALAFLTGHPQEGYILTLALVAWAGFESLRLVWGGRAIAAASRAALGAGLLGLMIGLVAVEWLPDLEAGAWGLRGARHSLREATRYHLHRLNWLQLLSPRALGGPADYLGGDNYWETVFSLGWVPLVLAAVALRRSPRRAAVRGWATLAAAAAVFAAGRDLGLFSVVYHVAPGMDRFRVPARSLFLVSLAGAVLAGLGVEAIAGSSPEGWSTWWRRYPWRAVALAIVIVGLGAAGRAGAVRPGGEPARWALGGARLSRDALFWAALVGTAAGFAHLARRPEDRRRVALGLGALALIELGLHGAWLLRTAPVAQFLGPDPVSADLSRLAPAGPFRIRARDAFYTDLRAVAHGLEKTNLNDSFQVQHAADLYETLYPLFDPPHPFFPATPARRAIRQGVLDRMGVALLVSDRPERLDRWPVAASGAWRGTPYWIYRNPTALPRAYVVPRAYPAPDGAAAVGLFPRVSPREAVLMATDPLGAGGPRQPFTPAAYESTDPDRVEVRVATAAPGLLVVADTWMPGWTAVVDGRPAPVLRGNRAQRVIPLPAAGPHHIVLSYRPPGLTAGLAITAAAGLAWLATAVVILSGRAGRSRPRGSVGRAGLRQAEAVQVVLRGVDRDRLGQEGVPSARAAGDLQDIRVIR